MASNPGKFNFTGAGVTATESAGVVTVNVPGGVSKSYVSGLELTYVSASSVSIGTGKCRNSDNTFDIVVTSAPTSSLAASGANGLDTGAEATNTWYAVHIIADSTAVNSPVGLFSLSATAPSLPAGYDKFRRIGWVRNNSLSDIISFWCNGNNTQRHYDYTDSITNRAVLLAGAAAAWTLVNAALFIAPTSREGHFQVRQNGTVSLLIGRDSGTTLIGILAGNEFSTDIPVTSAQAIHYINFGAGGSADIWVQGYDDNI